MNKGIIKKEIWHVESSHVNTGLKDNRHALSLGVVMVVVH